MGGGKRDSQMVGRGSDRGRFTTFYGRKSGKRQEPTKMGWELELPLSPLQHAHTHTLNKECEKKDRSYEIWVER